MPAHKMKVGVFSPNDPRPWVRRKNLDLMLEHEASLLAVLRKNGIDVVRGGDGFAREDQIAWNTDLVRRHVSNIARERPEALIINQGSWTFPYDSVDAVQWFQHETGDIARVIIFSYKDTQVPGLVAGMAAGGGLKRIGIPFSLCYGIVDQDPDTEAWLLDILGFFERRAAAAEIVKSAIRELRSKKYLALGGMSLKMPTTTADVDQWQKLFGVTYEALDQSELVYRALEMVRWEGEPGRGEYEILDPRVEAAVEYTHGQGHGSFDFSRDKLPDIGKFVLQLALYCAALDICDQYSIDFAGVKCQDELSGRYCTACLVSAYLSNDVGPDGKRKDVIPVACENDMDSALTQLWLHLLSGEPAGFGDFRDVEDGRLIIANCGQHPPYFFGPTEEDSVTKLDHVEYMGQEIFYDAGGSSVRGRTPGGQTMTVARLGRENLRYQVVTTVVETEDVDPAEHKLYDFSWPIIKGRLSIPDQLLIDVWPCNHLGFCYGDYVPHLAEMAHRLDIGFRVFDARGREYYRPS
jgi:L-fucose isomerase-like protein